MTLGGWAISQEVFDYIRMVLPEGCTILELGSGEGTAELAKHYTVHSVEHDEEWLDRCDSHYIYAPLKEHKPVRYHPDSLLWYDSDIVQKEIWDLDYDLLLVDGPIGNSRAGLLKYWDYFKDESLIVFDDINREYTWRVLRDLAWKLQKPYVVRNHKWPNKGDRPRQFGAILG